ncbi:unnamed protein product [Polarella glacialis]|uniref:J domain-containing protein n=1 Tax=Polarella glacialis TaxID=89957 RepID=A0A813ESR9_POLGL|nr:unnamed protein product [Polarella glacialis]CAE8646583.1 unnamed protein product [Polarella glacialis]
MASTCLYDVLGVSELAPAEEVRVAFRRCALVAHPDKGGSKDMFQALYQAFEVLSDPASRKIYDARHSSRQAVSSSRDPEEGPRRAGKRSRSSFSPASARARNANAQSTQSTQSTQSGSSCCGGAEAQDSSSRSTSRQPAEKTNEVERNGDNQSNIKIDGRRGPGATSATTNHGSSNSNCSSSSSQHSRNIGPSAAEGQQAGGAVGSERAASRSQESMCAKLYFLLKRLSPAVRRRVLGESFSESQRRALELWARDFRNRPEGDQGNPDQASKDKRHRDCEQQPGQPGQPGPDIAKQPGRSECQSASQEACVVLYKEDEMSDVSSSESSSSDRPRVLVDGAFDGDSSEDEIEIPAICDSAFRSEDADFEMKEEKGSNSGCERHQTQDAVSQDGAPQARRNHTGKTAVRGISTHNSSFYRSGVSILENVHVRSKDVKELGIAVEYLMVLTTMKHAASEKGTSSLDDRLRGAFVYALKEHGKTAEEMGLRWSIDMTQNFWVGGRQLRTSSIKSLDALVDAVRLLAPFHEQNRRGRGGVLFRFGLAELQEEWCAFRIIFSEVCAKAGACRETVLARLDSRAQSARIRREELLQFWEQQQMKQEDCLLYRRRPHRRQQGPSRRGEELLEERLLRRIGLWLERLRHLAVREARRASREAARAALAKARETARAALAKRAALREAQRTTLRERKERWTQMNRKDLTMADFLGTRFGAGAGSQST